ncbi:Exc2 family lipoprotein [Serratia sp. N21D137]|uniref:Exc2 family lipoprotein n=1 Tax=Serratia sp. N21D137 TaxID=3397495 RepID=UPI0039E1E1A2
MPSKRYRSIPLLAALLLCACTASQSSVERHARHATYQLANAHFDPNTQTNISKSAKTAIPFFEQFYQTGKKDRQDRLTREQAQQRVNEFRNPDFLPESEQKATMYNQSYTADSPKKQREILLENAIATYWDGYDGKP